MSFTVAGWVSATIGHPKVGPFKWAILFEFSGIGRVLSVGDIMGNLLDVRCVRVGFVKL